jgi:phosphatidylinositol alpha-mannosyltransferase
MKIGLVSDTCYPFPSGAAEYVYNLFLVLKRLGHEVRIITSSYGYRALHDSDIIRLGRTVLFPFNKAMVTLTFGTNLISELKRVFEKERFDILHIQGPVGPTLPLLSLICSNTVTVGIFASYYERSRLLGLSKPLIGRYLGKLKGRVCISMAAKKAISRYFDGDYTIIPQGIDLRRFSGSEGFPQFADGKLNILFVGRMEERKGLRYLIEAYSRVIREVGRVRLLIVGDGPEKRRCLSLAERVGGDILFTGRSEFNLLPRYYRSSHLFCSPATGSEAQGIVLLEALASGTPVVASDIDGYNEVITKGSDGLLVPPKDPESLARAIIELCKDKDLREKMASQGLKKAELYSWDRIGKALEAHYTKLLQ